MYDLKVKSKFIHFRAQGMTINKISKAMGVNRTTLIQWNKELYTDIKIAERDEFDKIFQLFMVEKSTRVTILAEALGNCYQKLDAEDSREDRFSLLKEIEKLTKLIHLETEDKKYSSLVQKSAATVNKEFPILVNDPDKYRKYDPMYEDEREYTPDWDEAYMEGYTEEEKKEVLKQKAEEEADLEESHRQIQLELEEEMKQDADENCIVTPLADEKRSKRIINNQPDLQPLKNKKESRSFKKSKSKKAEVIKS
jgi:hypothetical protein